MKLDIENIRKKIIDLKNIDDNLLIKKEGLTPAAILIPIFEKNDKSHLLFTQRSNKVSHHKGQISFPGGKFEAQDIDLEMTALRETNEEIGISHHDVQVIGKINNMVTNTNFLVTPYVGIIPYPYQFIISTDEIDELIEVPVEHLININNFEKKQQQYDRKIHEIYYYYYQKYTIWGVTGKILFDFLNLVKHV
ncbi:MAG: CoA pyrophosphatase [Candidatus Sericytochromatia bacterium]|nr:CoA pyrophosphatase [Candidatus Sericytochromatia bacterium]